jgi:predicted CXXCH cytochrome family protein
VAPVTQLCNDCHQDHGGIVQQPHPQIAQGECNLCHLAHGSEQPALLRRPQKTLCGTCHTNQIDPLRSFAAHAEAADLMCTSCHAPHDPAAQPAQVTRAGCVTCHTDLPLPGAFRFPHKPFAEERCADCHPSFHTDPDKPLLAATQSQSCNACHTDHGQVVTQTHPQVAKGECRLCHNGHGSDHPNQLVRAEADLCRSCHDAVFATTVFVGHTAAKLPACTSCHSPHVPQTAGPAVAVACAACHQEILAGRSRHAPVSQGECKLCHSEFHGQRPTQLAAVKTVCTDCHQLEKGPIAHPPYQQGRCESCHVVHSSPHTALLNRAPVQLCGACHATQTASFGRSRHGVRLSVQCAACHQAHNGQIDHLLHARTNALCDTCHRDLPHGFHPVSGGRDPLRGGELSCISCHAPHGSPHRADLRAPGDGLCLSCHRFEQPPTARR